MKLVEPKAWDEERLLKLIKDFDDEWTSMFWNSFWKASSDIRAYINIINEFNSWKRKTTSWWYAKTFVLEDWGIFLDIGLIYNKLIWTGDY